MVLVARDRMSTLAILGVPVGSGKHQRPGGGGSDNRKGKPECPTQSTSQPCLLLQQKLGGTVIPKGPTWRTGSWVGSPKPEDTFPLPNYGTSTIMTRYLRSKGAPFPPSDSSELFSGKRSRPHCTLTRPRNFRQTNSIPLPRRSHSSELWGLTIPSSWKPFLTWAPLLFEEPHSSLKVSLLQ